VVPGREGGVRLEKVEYSGVTRGQMESREGSQPHRVRHRVGQRGGAVGTKEGQRWFPRLTGSN
jgi:hypothetical protein